MKNSNVLKNNGSHNPDISIGSCEILSNQVEKISKALAELDEFVSHRDNFYFDFLIAQIYNSLEIINCVISINLDSFFHE